MQIKYSDLFSLLSAFVATAFAADIYVDSSFIGTSDGSQAAPFATIKDAVAAVGEGDTIWVYGSDTVSYVMEDDSAAVVIDPDNITIRGYTDLGEAQDWSQTNKMAKVYIPDGYANRSFEIDGNTQTPFTVNGANLKITGVFFDFGGKSFRQQNKGGNNMIVVTNSNFCVENSFFYMSSATGYSGSSTPISGKSIKNSVRHDMVFNRCGFHYTSSYRDEASAFGHCLGVLTVKNCYFERVYKMATGGSDEIRNTTLNVVSNIFYNCHSASDGWVDALFSKSGNYFPKNASIRYNRIIRDDYDPKSKWSSSPYNVLSHGGMYGGSYDKEFEFHHNTIVGADTAFITRRRNSGNENTDVWTPEIHNNIFILNDGGVFIQENEGSVPGKMFYNDYTTSYKVGSFIRNNAIMCDTFVGGDATTNSWYKLEYEEGAACGVVIQDNLEITTAPTFVNTTDVLDENFYRLRLEDYEWVRKNAWTGENGEYPRYIGALEPLPISCSLMIIK